MEPDFAPFVTLSEEMATALRQLQMTDVIAADAPSDTPEQPQSEAAEEVEDEQPTDEARKIVRWLDNLPSAEMQIDDWLDEDTPDEEALENATNLSKLVKIFVKKVKRARKKRPGLIQGDAVIENALFAASAMTHAVIEFTLAKLPLKHAKTATLQALLSLLPQQAALRQAQSVKRLTEIVSAGMERASGKNVTGKSTPERLAELSARMKMTAKTLQSVDSLAAPAREESIELAREILRRLNKLGFSDKPLKEMIDVAKPGDKAAFASAIEEAADMYKNVVLEAANKNSSIMQDQRVKAGNDAVNVFAHSIKLMAAKEMPNSIAAAQQIGADDAHNPNDWDNLKNHTVDRLVKSMEGGLEKAANNIEMEQDQEKDDDQQQQQDALDDAMQQTDSSKRKKKRKRRNPRSGSGKSKGSKKLSKVKQAIEADDYALKQGRFSRDAKAARAEDSPYRAPTEPAVSAVAPVQPTSTTKPTVETDKKSNKPTNKPDSSKTAKDAANQLQVTKAKTNAQTDKKQQTRPDQNRQTVKPDANKPKDPNNIAQGLNAEALAAIRQLGGALLKVGNEVRDIQKNSGGGGSNSMTSVGAKDKIMGDNKTMAQRVAESEVQKGPRNQGGPGM
jgi:hypothetical protein